MRDVHPPEGGSGSIVAKLPASWSTRPPKRREVFRFFRSTIVRRGVPADEAIGLADRLTHFFDALRLSRRQFLAQAAVGGLAIVIEGRHLLARAQATLPVPEGSLVGALDAPTLTADLLRPQDMLALHFEFFNLDLVGGTLVRQVAGEEAFVVAHLAHGQKLSAAGDPISDHAPQHIAEEAFLEPTPPNPDPDEPGTVEAALAGASRLAFRVPDGVSIPFTPSGLLSWAGLQQSVVPVALPPGAAPIVPPAIREPLNTETNIEAPWHLVLSPHSGAGWAHALGPVTRDGRTELWHTRLAVNEAGVIDEGNSAQRTMRAIWTRRRFVPEGDSGSPGPGFLTSLTANNRWQIVRLTSDFSLPDPLPTPVQVDRFMLTALGAWMNLRGNWPDPPAEEGLDVIEWRHIATMGRDQYVRIVELGYLFPFGHPAVMITITERKFQAVPAGDLAGKPAAYLRRRCFVVVRQPLMRYPGQSPEPHGGRHMPFRSLRCTTLITPNLDDCDSLVPFWLEVGEDYFLFHLVGEDADGQKSEFSAPMAFVKSTVGEGALATFIDDYNDLDVADARRRRPLNGQKVAMASNQGQADRKPGDTAVEISTLTFGAADPVGGVGVVGADQASFFPNWAEAGVRLDGVEQVKGGALSPVTIQPVQGFLEEGFDGANPGQIFAKLKNTVPLNFPADKSGGVITPNMSIGGLSRTLGPFGGSVDALPLPSTFNPSDFFSGAKILGGLFLREIIEEVGFGDLAKVPKTTTRTIYPGGDIHKLPEAIETRLNFQPVLKADDAGVFDPTGATMTLDATFLTPLDPPGEPSFEITGDLRNFRVSMVGNGDAQFLVLQFNRLTFKASKNKKPQVDVDINGVEFAGALSFVNSLKQLLKSSGTGPNIDISLNPPGVSAGWTLAIPTVGVGVITVQNIALSASLNIPFIDSPARVRFALSSRESPFLITVYGLGGGGFFGIAIGMDGVEVLEMSLEFGASVALDFGVASGELHVMGGIYYKMTVVTPAPPPGQPDELLELTAYIRMGGSMDVLGLISASVEFYLGMTYEAASDELWGQASMTVEVEVLFFSTSVTIRVERRLAGSGGNDGISKRLSIAGASLPRLGPTGNFADLVAQSDWNEYADAFARMN